MSTEPVAPCPHCGVPTVGQHIVGSVYDYQCDRCVEQIDVDFRAFVDEVINEAIKEDGER